MPPLRRQMGLLRSVPSFRLLFLATFGSGVGTWLAVIALQVDVYDRTHSGWWVAALLIANILPAIAIGLLFGPLIDRFSRKWLMIVSDVARLAVFAALPFVGSAGAIVALALVAGVATAFFRPAVLAGVPNLVEAGSLADANALLQMIEWVTTAVGPIVGGAIVAASGPHLAYWINAATFLFSAVLIVGIPARLLQSEQSLSRGHWRDIADGLSVVRGSRMLLTVLIVWTIVMAANGGVNVAEVFLAKVSYNAGDFGFGLLWAGTGVGLVIGGLLAAEWIARRGLATVYPIGLALFALGIALAAVVPTVWLGTAAMMLSGLGNGVAVVSNITFVQRGAPDRLRGRAFTVIISTNYAFLFLAFVAAGPLTDAVGARWVYAIAATTIAGAAATAVALTRGGAVVAPEPEPVA